MGVRGRPYSGRRFSFRGDATVSILGRQKPDGALLRSAEEMIPDSGEECCLLSATRAIGFRWHVREDEIRLSRGPEVSLPLVGDDDGDRRPFPFPLPTLHSRRLAAHNLPPQQRRNSPMNADDLERRAERLRQLRDGFHQELHNDAFRDHDGTLSSAREARRLSPAGAAFSPRAAEEAPRRAAGLLPYHRGAEGRVTE